MEERQLFFTAWGGQLRKVEHFKRPRSVFAWRILWNGTIRPWRYLKMNEMCMELHRRITILECSHMIRKKRIMPWTILKKLWKYTKHQEVADVATTYHNWV